MNATKIWTSGRTPRWAVRPSLAAALAVTAITAGCGAVGTGAAVLEAPAAEEIGTQTFDPSNAAVPRSADGAENWLASTRRAPLTPHHAPERRAAAQTADDACRPSGPVTADAAERRIADCLVAIDDAYVECMRSTRGTPDSLEHWVDSCRVRSIR